MSCKNCKHQANESIEEPCNVCEFGNGYKDMTNPINAIPIPQGATVGEILTSIFPNEKIITGTYHTFIGNIKVESWLWNAPYSVAESGQKESENE